MTAAIVLTLPEPPSANRYWRHARGRTFLSADAIKYRARVFENRLQQSHIAEPWALAGKISVSIAWYRSRKSGDLDNRIKILLDALAHAQVYQDDAQIVELHAYRHDDKHNPRVVVTCAEKL